MVLLLLLQKQWIFSWPLCVGGFGALSSSSLKLLLCKRKRSMELGRGLCPLPSSHSSPHSHRHYKGECLVLRLSDSIQWRSKEFAHKCNFPLCPGHPAIPNYMLPTLGLWQFVKVLADLFLPTCMQSTTFTRTLPKVNGLHVLSLVGATCPSLEFRLLYCFVTSDL